jgi:hypothetical protein
MLSKFQKEVIGYLIKCGICIDREDAINWLLQRAIQELIVSEYLPKLAKFRESLKRKQ